METQKTPGIGADHPLLVTFPLALYTTALVSFGAYKATMTVRWFQLGFIATVAAVGLAAVAVLPAMIDWFGATPSRRSRKLAGGQLVLELAALAAMAVNAWMQSKAWQWPRPEAGAAISLSCLSLALAVGGTFIGAMLREEALLLSQSKLRPAQSAAQSIAQSAAQSSAHSPARLAPVVSRVPVPRRMSLADLPRRISLAAMPRRHHSISPA